MSVSAVHIAEIHPEVQTERTASESQRLMDGSFINLAPPTSFLHCFAKLPSEPLHEF